MYPLFFQLKKATQYNQEIFLEPDISFDLNIQHRNFYLVVFCKLSECPSVRFCEFLFNSIHPALLKLCDPEAHF